MSNVNLMTNEERERFLPVIKNVIRVFEKSFVDENEINELIAIVYLAIVFYNGARAVRALRFGLLHWQSRQRQHY